jgi:hypothetical protein
MNNMKIYVTDQLLDFEKFNEHKFDQFNKETVQIKSSLDNLKDVRKDITSLYLKLDEKCSY